MDTGSNIFKFLKWLKQEILQDINLRLHDLDGKLKQQEKDTAELKKLCEELLRAISKLEGKYENVEEVVYQRLVNRFQKEIIKIQKKDLNRLEQRLEKIPSKQDLPSLPEPSK